MVNGQDREIRAYDNIGFPPIASAWGQHTYLLFKLVNAFLHFGWIRIESHLFHCEQFACQAKTQSVEYEGVSHSLAHSAGADQHAENTQ
eukprot:1186541-Prorocentrum_minimum.AAC.8